MCTCIADLDKALEEHNTMFEKIIYFKHPSMEMVSTIQIAVKKINPRGKKANSFVFEILSFLRRRMGKRRR